MAFDVTDAWVEKYLRWVTPLPFSAGFPQVRDGLARTGRDRDRSGNFSGNSVAVELGKGSGKRRAVH